MRTVKPVHELRIGVIGLGHRGWFADFAHRPEEGVRVVAGADIRRERLQRFRAKYGQGAFTTTDYRQLLARDDVDAVFVTSPDYCHEEHALAALRAGKAVYLEKPMAITVAGCDRLLRAARTHKAKLYLGHNMRHFPVILKMKELIDAGAIGEVKAGWCRHFVSYGGDAYFKDWHAERSKATGLLLQKGAHDIDVLHWLCGGYSRRVTAMGGLTLYGRIASRHSRREEGDASFRMENWPPLAQKRLNPVLDVEDISMMLMQLDNGVFCSYQQCHYTPDAWRNYTIIGTRGRVENFGDMPGESVVRLWNRRCNYKARADVEFVMRRAKGSHGGSDPAIVQEFIRYVRDGAKVTTSPVAARYSVAAGFQATRSLRAGGRPMTIAPVPRDLATYFDRDLAT